MAHLSCWMAAYELEPADLHKVEIERFVEERRATGRVQLASIRALAPLLGHLPREKALARPPGRRRTRHVDLAGHPASTGQARSRDGKPS
jgi:hypothetical protein